MKWKIKKKNYSVVYFADNISSGCVEKRGEDVDQTRESI